MQSQQLRPCRGVAFSSGRPALQRPSRVTLQVQCTAVAKAATLPCKGADGSEKASQSLALRVAEGSATGLVHRFLVMVQQNERRGTACTKTKSEVRGGGKKPMAQKGTGNARRGSSRSPLFPGGGVIFGPKPRDWSIKMNKKERRLAMATAIQSAAGDMVVVDTLEGQVPDKKTKSLVALLEKLGADLERHTLLIFKDANEDVMLAGRNIPTLAINTANNLKVFDILHCDKIIVESGALAHIQSFYGENKEEAVEVAK